MFCQSCGKENPAAATFCGHCGIAIPRTAAGASPEYAGFWLRFGAILIDGLLWSFFAGTVMLLIVLLLFRMVLEGATEPVLILAMAVPYFGLYLGWYFYFAFLESSSWQASIGKRIVGLYVTDKAGNRLTFGRATGRSFSKMISDMTLGVGYIMAGFTEKKQALHDIIAECLVLRRR